MRKIETEMGSLREGRFAGSGRGVENESEGWGSGDDSETDGRRRKHKSAPIVGARLSRTSGIEESNNY